jgi:hypothetical protein
MARTNGCGFCSGQIKQNKPIAPNNLMRSNNSDDGFKNKMENAASFFRLSDRFFQLTHWEHSLLSCQKMSLTKLQPRLAWLLQLATSWQQGADCAQPSRIAG